MAAGLAGLPLATLRGLRGEPEFDELLDDCRAFEALPKAERDAVLERLVRAAVERALGDGRVGAIPAAMRLLGMVPCRALASEPGAVPAGERVPGGLPAVMRDVLLDDEGEWVAPDGLPVMPGRPLAVADAPGGPVRVLDIDPATVPASFLEGLDDFDRAQAHDFNRAAYPSGGPQWDPVTRTLGCWGEPPAGPPLTAEAEATAAASARAETYPPPAEPSAPSGIAPTEEPAPAPLPAPSLPPRVPAILPPRDDLEARIHRLLASTTATGPADADLAEAVCALRWPNWPAYRGGLDLAAVGRALHGRRVDERTLTRLGGSACARRAPTPAHPPPRPPPGDPQPRQRTGPSTTRRRRTGNGGRAPP
jgi:hypothetical protein